MRPTKKLQVEADKWTSNNGACEIKIKEEEINLYNSGLFQDMDENKANLWIRDLDSTINYLMRLRRQLKKMGFETGLDIKKVLAAREKEKKNGR